MALSNLQPHCYHEIVELFASGATPEKILNFRPSPETQERVRELLSRNKDGSLSTEELAELEHFSDLEHFLRLVKARARTYIHS